MSKVLKWLAYGVGGLLGVALIAALGIFVMSNNILNKQYADIPTSLTEIPTDAAAVERGDYLVSTHFCTDCHGEDLGGKLFLDEDNIATLYTSNLTSGEGSATADFTPADWDRAIRHGVGPDGRALYLMTASDYYHLSDADVAAIVAYIKSVEPVDREIPAQVFGPIGRFGLVAGMFPPPDAAKIDHDAPRPTPERGPTAEYGEYLVQVCTGCHGANFEGQPILGTESISPDITAAGNVGEWSAEEFIEAIRTGNTPDGRSLDPAQMPWPYVARMTDEDLTAIYLYLQSLGE